MKKQRGCLISLLILGAFLITVVLFFINIINTLKKNEDRYEQMDLNNLDLSLIEDGTYTGTEDAGIVKATVEVTVKNHIITEVRIISHQSGKGQPADAIVKDIVKANSLEVDAISGATYSSNVIKTAVYNALTKKTS